MWEATAFSHPCCGAVNRLMSGLWYHSLIHLGVWFCFHHLRFYNKYLLLTPWYAEMSKMQALTSERPCSGIDVTIFYNVFAWYKQNFRRQKFSLMRLLKEKRIIMKFYFESLHNFIVFFNIINQINSYNNLNLTASQAKWLAWSCETAFVHTMPKIVIPNMDFIQ